MFTYGLAVVVGGTEAAVVGTPPVVGGTELVAEGALVGVVLVGAVADCLDPLPQATRNSAMRLAAAASRYMRTPD